MGGFCREAGYPFHGGGFCHTWVVVGIVVVIVLAVCSCFVFRKQNYCRYCCHCSDIENNSAIVEGKKDYKKVHDGEVVILCGNGCRNGDVGEDEGG